MHLKSEKIHITLEGLGKLKRELKRLLDARSAKAIDPEELQLINERVEEIEQIIKAAEVIRKPVPEKQSTVYLGATVVVQVDSQTDELTIVGTIEANPSLGRISDASPVGRALLGRKVGDTVVVSSALKTVYKIIEIKY